MPIYKYGDIVKVRTNGTWKIGRVISVTGNTSVGYNCKVKFGGSIIPNEMIFPEDKLESYSSFNRYLNTNMFCPVCGSKWHEIESPIFGKKEIWKDCIKCNKTREQLVEGL